MLQRFYSSTESEQDIQGSELKMTMPDIKDEPGVERIEYAATVDGERVWRVFCNDFSSIASDPRYSQYVKISDTEFERR